MANSLIEYFSIISDTRQRCKFEHDLIDIIILCVFALFVVQKVGKILSLLEKRIRDDLKRGGGA